MQHNHIDPDHHLCQMLLARSKSLVPSTLRSGGYTKFPTQVTNTTFLYLLSGQWFSLLASAHVRDVYDHIF